MKCFKGLSAFPVTPADESGRVDTETLCHLVTRLERAGVQSIGLLGSTGTYAYLGQAERQRAVEAAVQCRQGTTPLIVGAGALRTDDARALARHAERSGADALLLAPMSYTPLTDDEVYEHYRAVAGATGLPVCIYNNPTATHFTFSLELLARLAGLPNIAAVKMPLPADANLAADLERLRDTLPEDFPIGYSGDWGCTAGLLAGGDTWYSVIGGLLPEPALQMTRAALSGHTQVAQRLDSYFRPLWTLFQELGSLRVIYAMARELSLIRTSPPRPVLPLADEDQRRVAEALDELKANLDSGSGTVDDFGVSTA